MNNDKSYPNCAKCKWMKQSYSIIIGPHNYMCIAMGGKNCTEVHYSELCLLLYEEEKDTNISIESTPNLNLDDKIVPDCDTCLNEKSEICKECYSFDRYVSI